MRGEENLPSIRQYTFFPTRWQGETGLCLHMETDEAADAGIGLGRISSPAAGQPQALGYQDLRATLRAPCLSLRSMQLPGRQPLSSRWAPRPPLGWTMWARASWLLLLANAGFLLGPSQEECGGVLLPNVTQGISQYSLPATDSVNGIKCYWILPAPRAAAVELEVVSNQTTPRTDAGCTSAHLTITLQATEKESEFCGLFWSIHEAGKKLVIRARGPVVITLKVVTSGFKHGFTLQYLGFPSRGMDPNVPEPLMPIPTPSPAREKEAGFFKHKDILMSPTWSDQVSKPSGKELARRRPAGVHHRSQAPNLPVRPKRGTRAHPVPGNIPTTRHHQADPRVSSHPNSTRLESPGESASTPDSISTTHTKPNPAPQHGSATAPGPGPASSSRPGRFSIPGPFANNISGPIGSSQSNFISGRKPLPAPTLTSRANINSSLVLRPSLGSFLFTPENITLVDGAQSLSRAEPRLEDLDDVMSHQEDKTGRRRVPGSEMGQEPRLTMGDDETGSSSSDAEGVATESHPNTPRPLAPGRSLKAGPATRSQSAGNIALFTRPGGSRESVGGSQGVDYLHGRGTARDPAPTQKRDLGSTAELRAAQSHTHHWEPALGSGKHGAPSPHTSPTSLHVRNSNAGDLRSHHLLTSAEASQLGGMQRKFQFKDISSAAAIKPGSVLESPELTTHSSKLPVVGPSIDQETDAESLICESGASGCAQVAGIPSAVPSVNNVDTTQTAPSYSLGMDGRSLTTGPINTSPSSGRFTGLITRLSTTEVIISRPLANSSPPSTEVDYSDTPPNEMDLQTTSAQVQNQEVEVTTLGRLVAPTTPSSTIDFSDPTHSGAQFPPSSPLPVSVTNLAKSQPSELGLLTRSQPPVDQWGVVNWQRPGSSSPASSGASALPTNISLKINSPPPPSSSAEGSLVSEESFTSWTLSSVPKGSSKLPIAHVGTEDLGNLAMLSARPRSTEQWQWKMLTTLANVAEPDSVVETSSHGGSPTSGSSAHPKITPQLSSTLVPTELFIRHSTPSASTLSTDTRQTWSPDISRTLSPDVSQTLNTDISQTLSPDVSQTLNTDVSQTLSPEVSQTLSPDVSQTQNTDISQTLGMGSSLTQNMGVSWTQNTDIRRTSGPNVSQTLKPDISQTLGPDVSQTLNTDISQTLSPDVSQTLNTDVSQTLSPEVSQTLSPDVSQTLGPDVSRTLSAGSSWTLLTDITQTQSTHIRRTRSTDVDWTQSRDSRSLNADITQSLGTDASQTQSTDISQTLSPDINWTESIDMSQTESMVVSETESTGSRRTFSTNNSQTEGSDISRTERTDISWTLGMNISQTLTMDVSETQSQDIINTLTSHIRPTLSTDVSQTQNTDISQTLGMGSSLTQNMGVSWTQSTDIRRTSGPNVSQTLKPDISQTLGPDVSQTLNTDISRTLGPDVSRTLSAGSIRTLLTDITQTQSTHIRRTQSTDIDWTQSRDISLIENTGIIGTDSTNISQTESMNISQTESADITQTEDTDISRTQGTDISQTESADISQTQSTDISQTEDTDISWTQGTYISQTQGTDISQTQGTDISQTLSRDSRSLSADITQSLGTDASQTQSTDINWTESIDMSQTESMVVSETERTDISWTLGTNISQTLNPDVSQTLNTDISPTLGPDVSRTLSAGSSRTLLTDITGTQSTHIRTQSTDIDWTQSRDISLIESTGIIGTDSTDIGQTLSTDISQTQSWGSQTMSADINWTESIDMGQTESMVVSETESAGSRRTFSTDDSQTEGSDISQTERTDISWTLGPNISQTLTMDISETQSQDIINTLTSHIRPTDVSTDVSQTQSTDISRTLGPDVSRTLIAGSSRTLLTDITQTQSTHIRRTESTDIDWTQSRDVSLIESIIGTDSTNVSQTESPDISQTQSTDISQTQDTGISQTQDAGISQNESTDISQTLTRDVIQTQSQDIINTLTSHVRPTLSTDASKTQTTGVSRTQSTGVIGTRGTGINQTRGRVGSALTLPTPNTGSFALLHPTSQPSINTSVRPTSSAGDTERVGAVQSTGQQQQQHTPATSGAAEYTVPLSTPLEGHKQIFIVEDRLPQVREGITVKFPTMLILNMSFDHHLKDSKSDEYQNLAKDFTFKIVPFYHKVPGFQQLQIKRFSVGGVQIEFDAIFTLKEMQWFLLEPNLIFNVSGLRLVIAAGFWIGGAQVVTVYVTEKLIALCGEVLFCQNGFQCVHRKSGNVSCTSLCHTAYCKNSGICTHSRGQGPICQCPVGSDYWYMGSRCDHRVTQQSLIAIVFGVVFALALLLAAVAIGVLRRYKVVLIEAEMDQTRSSYKRFSRFDDFSNQNQSQSWLNFSVNSLDNPGFSNSDELIHLHILDTSFYSCHEESETGTYNSRRTGRHSQPPFRHSLQHVDVSISSINGHTGDSGKASDLSVCSWPVEPYQWSPFPILYQHSRDRPFKGRRPHSYCEGMEPVNMERNWTA
ncbi:uro-adherence factor A-like [Amblyraja radiata]|uniref:uro-adherence factor A-like n=1 Tax=Amblyraja radiata TaxID=386614 RepID=UPI0014033D25|nr:uro-adherence factor A-like [Amblyraja radiata]